MGSVNALNFLLVSVIPAQTNIAHSLYFFLEWLEIYSGSPK